VATDDQQILVAGTEATPAAFVIPGNGQLRPKAVFASYDGTGAGGSFVPALKIISDGGETVAICPADVTLAAGASADVSWFPRVAAAAQAASSGVIPVAAGRVDPGTPVTVPAHGAIEIPWFEVNFSDSSQFGWSSGSPTILTVTNGGILLYSLTIMPWVDWPVSAAGFIRFNGHTGGDISFELPALFASYTPVDVFSDQATGPYPVAIHGITAPIDLGSSKTWGAHIFNNTASNWQFGNGTHFTVARLSDLVLD
jgi:hypothetical protein